MPGLRPYVSLDLETTGLDENNCQIIQIAAILDDWWTPVDQLPWFGGFVRHKEYKGEPYALAMNADILRKLANDEMDALSPADLSQYFRNWLHSNGVDPKEKILAAGKNFGSFDLQFLKKLPDCLKFKHRCFDPGNLFWNPILDLDGPPDTKTCMERAGLSGEVAHTAYDDALVVVKLMRFARQYRINEIGRPSQTREGSGPCDWKVQAEDRLARPRAEPIINDITDVDWTPGEIVDDAFGYRFKPSSTTSAPPRSDPKHCEGVDGLGFEAFVTGGNKILRDASLTVAAREGQDGPGPKPGTSGLIDWAPSRTPQALPVCGGDSIEELEQSAERAGPSLTRLPEADNVDVPF